MTGRLATDPEDAQAWNGRGAVLHAMKRNREAVANFDKAVELKPDFTDALTNRGLLRWAEHGDFAGATADLRQALAADPRQPYALGELHHLKMYGADWESFDADKSSIDDGVRNGRRVVRPFVYQALALACRSASLFPDIFRESSSGAPSNRRHPFATAMTGSASDMSPANSGTGDRLSHGGTIRTA